MLHSFAARWRTPLLGALFIVSLASCTTLTFTSQPSSTRPAERPNSPGDERVQAWLALREHLRQETLSELDQLELVNNFFNSLAWRPDLDNWGMEDYWATPLETLMRGAGDCEDLAIAKYFTLLEAGVDEERLRLSYVWHWEDGQREAHLVLAFYPAEGGEALILDNLMAEALTLAERQDLEKVYTFNRWNLWLAGDARRAVSVASQEQLPKWRQLNDRMEQEAGELFAAL